MYNSLIVGVVKSRIRGTGHAAKMVTDEIHTDFWVGKALKSSLLDE
jgi:hypothetical protein